MRSNDAIVSSRKTQSNNNNKVFLYYVKLATLIKRRGFVSS